MAEVTLTGVSKSFGSDVALDDLTMIIPDGSFVVLLGPTGAGKTTTLRMVSGLDRPDAGVVKIGGRDMARFSPAQRDVAMVFQQYSLYPHLTVRQNLEFPLKSPILKTPQDEIDRKVGEVAEVLQISHKLDNKATLLYVTHDQIEAMTMATHVGVLDHGRLVQFGSPREIYENPVSVYSASRLGQPRINVLPADIFGGAPPGAVSIGLRPEHIVQGEGEDSFVQRVEHLGDQTRLHLSFKNNDLITVTDAHTPLKGGDIVKIRPDKPFYFDAAGARMA
jgi:multiple sugar transport system ATP-binding protein